MQSHLSRENVIRGVILFTLFTLVGLLLSFFWSDTQDIKSGAEELKQVFLDMKYEYLLIVCVCMFVWVFVRVYVRTYVRI